MWKETDKGKTGHREIEGGGLSPPHTTMIWQKQDERTLQFYENHCIYIYIKREHIFKHSYYVISTRKRIILQLWQL